MGANGVLSEQKGGQSQKASVEFSNFYPNLPPGP